MKLYHFTNHVWLQRILKEGISRGDVPTTRTGGYNAVWLTSQGDAAAQKWTQGANGKQSVRLTVEMPDNDPLLKTWNEVCREHRVSGSWRKILNSTGGNGDAHWHIYHGTIPPEWIAETTILQQPTHHELEYMRADREGRFEAVETGMKGVSKWRIRPK